MTLRFAVPDEHAGLVLVDSEGEPTDDQTVPDWVREKLARAEENGLIPMGYAVVWDDSDLRDEDVVRVWDWADLIDDGPYDFESLWDDAPMAY